MAGIENNSGQSQFARALMSINTQMPRLSYYGLAFWMAWNTIAFSGSFWLHDTLNSFRTQDLIIFHLATSTVTLLIFGIFSRQTSKIIIKNWFTLIGGLVAFAGSVLIVITRESLFPVRPLFILGGCLCGPGTTVLFLRSANLLGSLKPQQSIITIAGCTVVAVMVYFTLSACPNELATVFFMLLPLIAVCLYGIKTNDTPFQTQVLQKQAGLSKLSIGFLISIFLCSATFEIARSLVLINIPPSYTVNSTNLSLLMGCVVMFLLILFACVSRNNFRYDLGYSLSIGALVIFVLLTNIFAINEWIVSSISITICTLFNTLIWTMLAYIVYQAASSAILIF
ncbi:MAG: hypothetical protein LUB61_01535, partial [Eggerthellaceae bacterium]|nr:hypothetical protein [Eggerthellaceae bacterium]